MDIKKLTVKELESLKSSIDSRILDIKREEEDELKRKDSVKNKTKLLQLSSKDRIFKIEIFDHVDTREKVIRTGFVKVDGVGKGKDGSGFNYSFGGSSSWFSDEDGEKHYFLSVGFGADNFVFYTLNPQTWLDDLKLAREAKIKNKVERFEKELNAFKKSLTKFDKFSAEINSSVAKKIKEDNIRIIRTESELSLFQEDVRYRQFQENPIKVDVSNFPWDRDIDWDSEYVRVTRIDNLDVVEVIKKTDIYEN